MNHRLSLPTDFHNSNTLKFLAQAGTVGLPYPPPASGPVHLGINLDHPEDLPWASPRYYLRVVQTVSPRQVITRSVNLQELRGVTLPTVDLQVLFLESAAGIPTTGKNLVIVAQVGDEHFYRIFDSQGKCAVDTRAQQRLDQATDTKRRDVLGEAIGELKKLLPDLRAPHVVTTREANRVLAQVTAIVGHTRMPLKENGATREFLTTNQIARDLLTATERLGAAKKENAGAPEELLYPDAVIHVPEQAPVHVQITYAFGVTAAEAAENVECVFGDPCPCPEEGDPR